MRAVETSYIAFDDIPVWTVSTQGIAARPLDLDQCLMIEAGVFKSERLAARAGTDFDGGRRGGTTAGFFGHGWYLSQVAARNSANTILSVFSLNSAAVRWGAFHLLQPTALTALLQVL